jgi:catechol 2,3-dioxygenase-like lactoylglutathione lyase family enzyme
MTDDPPPAIRVLGIDHVQLAMPPGGEPEARRFYGGILGLREVAKPAALADRGGCWFAGSAGAAVHLGVDARFVAARKAHPGLVVADLAAARHALRSAGVAVIDDDAPTGVARCYTADPFGNRIELIDAADAGFTTRPEPPLA